MRYTERSKPAQPIGDAMTLIWPVKVIYMVKWHNVNWKNIIWCMCFKPYLIIRCSVYEVQPFESYVSLTSNMFLTFVTERPYMTYRISPYISREIYPRTKYYTDNSSYTRVTPSGKKLYRKQVEFSKFGRTMTRQWRAIMHELMNFQSPH